MTCCDDLALAWDGPAGALKCQCGVYWAPILFIAADEKRRTTELAIKLHGGLDKQGAIVEVSKRLGWTRHKFRRELVKWGLRPKPKTKDPQ